MSAAPVLVEHNPLLDFVQANKHLPAHLLAPACGLRQEALRAFLKMHRIQIATVAEYESAIRKRRVECRLNNKNEKAVSPYKELKKQEQSPQEEGQKKNHFRQSRGMDLRDGPLTQEEIDVARKRYGLATTQGEIEQLARDFRITVERLARTIRR